MCIYKIQTKRKGLKKKYIKMKGNYCYSYLMRYLEAPSNLDNQLLFTGIDMLISFDAFLNLQSETASWLIA